jgi:hypothetical protein
VIGKQGGRLGPCAVLNAASTKIKKRAVLEILE